MAEFFDSLTGRTHFRTFVQYFIAFCSRPEAVNDVICGKFMRPTVPDKCLKFRDLAETILEEFHPKPSEAAFDGYFRDNSSARK